MATLDSRVLDRVRGTAPRPVDDVSEAVLRRAKYLDERDQLLIRLVLRGSVTRREMARLVGTQPGTVSRRVQRIARRLHDPIVVILADDRCPLPEENRQIGLEYFLRKMTVSEIADLHRISPRVVSEVITFIRGWYRGMTQRR